jgi:hypothetical protein
MAAGGNRWPVTRRTFGFNETALTISYELGHYHIFRGEVAWDGIVETFDIEGHSKAKRCYAWSFLENGEPQYTTVLEIPPVDSPQSAVKVAIAAKARK